jgi:pyruvate dehydrogenase E2 component (dihydrolipoamide acetyltransferase)
MKFIAGISSAAALICVLSWTDEQVSAFVQSSTTLSSSRTAVRTIDAITTRGFETSLNAEAIKITMPSLSSTMKEGRVVTWLKSEGDEIEAGEAIMVVESDKADMDVEAFEDGYLAKILTQEGETAEVGAVVALVAALQGDIASVAEGGGGHSSGVVANGAAAAIVAETSPVVAGGELFCIPRIVSKGIRLRKNFLLTALVE